MVLIFGAHREAKAHTPTHAAAPCPHDMTVSPPVMSASHVEDSVVASVEWRDCRRARRAGAWNVVLFEKVRENASIDWTIKESVKAKLKVIVKRILRQFGYPPDMQMLATETVLKQAELIAEEMVAGK
jgi:hypothetical protein